ncbi:MAG TPA: membrane protein insertion efficiency factor YidD [Acidobacteriota bacterium]|nr:membrane protein insertion efficiency factor YidD [Acidobacteriota bacterium]
MKKAALYILRQYKRFVSPLLGNNCRFYPTCSSYAYQAIEKYGLTKGAFLGIKRLFKCHPFHRGGIDSVP